MGLDVWLSFVLVALVAVLSPGPAVLLAVTHASRYGVRRAVFPILGNITGVALLTFASALGVGALLAASSDLFLVLRIAGGAYLIYLGIKLLRAGPMNPDGGLDVLPSRRKSYLQGVMVALSNPKALLFIGALFPQFLDPAQPICMPLTVMGLTLMSMSFAALVLYAGLARTLLAHGRRAIYSKINKITGGLFVFLGIAIAAGGR